MRFDAKDALAVAFGSVGFLLGALLAVVLRSEFVIVWSVVGLVVGTGFAAYFLSSGGE